MVVQNPPAGYPVITPYLYYRDVGAAMDFLIAAFGFTERIRTRTPDGEIAHAELALGDSVIMLGCPSADYRSPRDTGHVHHLVHAYVDDVDTHFARAKAAGATVIAEPETKPYGDRNYLVEDVEGQQWGFAQHVADVPIEAQ